MSTSRWAFERGILWGVELDAPTPRVVPKLEARFQECGPDTAIALAAAMALRDASQVRDRLATGRRCMLAWVGDEIAAYGWISVRPEYISEQEREIALQANEAYIWNCATLPAFRGRLVAESVPEFANSGPADFRTHHPNCGRLEVDTGFRKPVSRMQNYPPKSRRPVMFHASRGQDFPACDKLRCVLDRVCEFRRGRVRGMLCRLPEKLGTQPVVVPSPVLAQVQSPQRQD